MVRVRPGRRRPAAAARRRRDPRAQRPAVPAADGGALRRRRRIPPGQPAGQHLRDPGLAHGPGQGAPLPAARLAAAPPGGARPARGRARGLGAGRRRRPRRGQRSPRRRRRPSTAEPPRAALRDALLDAARGLVREPETGRDGRSRRDATARRRVVVAADEHLRAHLARPIYTEELCAALGVSPATLAAAFHAAFGVSPHRFLKLRRLAIVRNVLGSREGPAPLVKSVALAHGFWHLGQFAAEYPAVFGEMPSETLARARGTRGPAGRRGSRRLGRRHPQRARQRCTHSVGESGASRRRRAAADARIGVGSGARVWVAADPRPTRAMSAAMRGNSSDRKARSARRPCRAGARPRSRRGAAPTPPSAR